MHILRRAIDEGDLSPGDSGARCPTAIIMLTPKPWRTPRYDCRLDSLRADRLRRSLSRLLSLARLRDAAAKRTSDPVCLYLLTDCRALHSWSPEEPHVEDPANYASPSGIRASRFPSDPTEPPSPVSGRRKELCSRCVLVTPQTSFSRPRTIADSPPYWKHAASRLMQPVRGLFYVC